MVTRILSAALAFAGAMLLAQDGEVTFRSEVNLARVDALVVDRTNRAITGLGPEDFVLLETGKRKEIRNFAHEEAPVDVLLLIDISGSMRPHVEQLASASSTALQVLGEADRVAIMSFDTRPQVRLPFRENRAEVTRALEVLLGESFNGGTDITGALYEAARFMERNARREARRATVILTDDQTGGGRDELGVGRALARADTVLSALLAPDAMGTGRTPYPRGSTWPGGGWPGSGGGGWPGSTWPGGGGGGGGVWGRRSPGSGGPVILGPQTQSAGTAEIARSSGGDSMRVDDANSLEMTLQRIRQRYALHYNVEEGTQLAEARQVEVLLSETARRRYPDAEVRYRRVNMNGDGGSGPVQTTSARDGWKVEQSADPASPSAHEDQSQRAGLKRRPAVSERSGTRVSSVPGEEGSAQPNESPAVTNSAPVQQEGGWRKVETEQPRGWRKLKPGEQP